MVVVRGDVPENRLQSPGPSMEHPLNFSIKSWDRFSQPCDEPLLRATRESKTSPDHDTRAKVTPTKTSTLRHTMPTSPSNLGVVPGYIPPRAGRLRRQIEANSMALSGAGVGEGGGRDPGRSYRACSGSRSSGDLGVTDAS